MHIVSVTTTVTGEWLEILMGKRAPRTLVTFFYNFFFLNISNVVVRFARRSPSARVCTEQRAECALIESRIRAKRDPFTACEPYPSVRLRT